MTKAIDFTALWLTEAIRLKELHHGPLDDAAYIHALRQQDTSPREKIINRAQRLATASGLSKDVQNYRSLAKFALFLLLIVAIFTGVGLAYAGLGGSGGVVNLLSAWLAILGLHILSLLIWLGLLFTPKRSDKDYPLIGQAWLWLSKRLARGPHAALVPNALLSLTRQQRATSWSLSSITHGFWFVTLAAALATTLFLLSTRRYTFVWETTILSSGTLENLANALSWIPSLLGFPTPELLPLLTQDATDNLALHALWSSWLIGQIIVYGLLVRGLAFVLSFFISLLRLARVHLDIDSAAYAPLLARLQPIAVKTGIDAPAPTIATPELHTAPLDLSGDGTLVLGIELDPQSQWPLTALAQQPHLVDGGNIESREQRHQLLTELGQRQQPWQRILFVCDAEQTPDRSHLNLMQTIAQFGQEHLFLLINNNRPERNQSELWLEALTQAGIKREAIFLDLNTLTEQLARPLE